MKKHLTIKITPDDDYYKQKDIILQSNTIDNYKIHLNPLSENLTYKNIKFSTTKPIPKPINVFSKG